MAFDWAIQAAGYRGQLNIKSMGPAGQNSPGLTTITTNNANVTFVDNLRMQASITEATQGPKTLVMKSSDVGAGANAYVLPWSGNFASKTRLGHAQNKFVTPDLNGCAIFVSGPVAGPTVVHINATPDMLDQGEPAFKPSPKGTSNAQMNKTITAFGNEMTAFKVQMKNPMWDAIYQAFAIKLMAQGLIPKENFGALMPTDYLAAGVDSAAVFGLCDGSWSFFKNVGGQTTKFWPA